MTKKKTTKKNHKTILTRRNFLEFEQNPKKLRVFLTLNESDDFTPMVRLIKKFHELAENMVCYHCEGKKNHWTNVRYINYINYCILTYE